MRHTTIGLLAVAALAMTGLSACSSDDDSTDAAASSTSSSQQAESTVPTADSTPTPDEWILAASEDFSTPFGTAEQDWVIDPLGEDSPWYVDEFSDDGEYYQVLGGEYFDRALDSMNIMRKRVEVGENGWLTLELAAQDRDKDGVPDSEPIIEARDGLGYIEIPSNTSAGILTATNPLPDQYRVEYELHTMDFGGKYDGSWEYDGKYNGYAPGECQTNFPWVRKGDYSQDEAAEVDPCDEPWGDVTRENGYYFLSIMDYAKPAPHNNIFIHSHRKVGMDSYSVDAEWAENYKVCNPETKELYEYTESSALGVNQIFFDGSAFRDPAFAYNEFVMPTPCGVRYGDDPDATIVATAEVQPELMPGETYTFAIERKENSYVTEMTGNFRYIGQATIRNEREFTTDDGRSIWHYNQTAEEYDGEFNQTLDFEGPYGEFSKEMWPAGTEYPDNFIIGIPHLNYYEGTATIDNVAVYTRDGNL